MIQQIKLASITLKASERETISKQIYRCDSTNIHMLSLCLTISFILREMGILNELLLKLTHLVQSLKMLFLS